MGAEDYMREEHLLLVALQMLLSLLNSVTDAKDPRPKIMNFTQYIMLAMKN